MWLKSMDGNSGGAINMDVVDCIGYSKDAKTGKYKINALFKDKKFIVAKYESKEEAIQAFNDICSAIASSGDFIFKTKSEKDK